MIEKNPNLYILRHIHNIHHIRNFFPLINNLIKIHPLFDTLHVIILSSHNSRIYPLMYQIFISGRKIAHCLKCNHPFAIAYHGLSKNNHLFGKKRT